MAQEWVRLREDARIAAGALRGAPVIPTSAPLFLTNSSPATPPRGRVRRFVRDQFSRLSAWLDQPVPRTSRGEPIIQGGRWVGDPADPPPAPRSRTDWRP